MTRDLSIVVVSYGDNLPLLARSVGSILATTAAHRDRYEMIVALSQAGASSRAYAAGLRASSGGADLVIDMAYNGGVEAGLYLALRAARAPILLRFDDDSWCVRAGWAEDLSAIIRALPDTWGVVGRLKRFGSYQDRPAGQGWLSRQWIRRQPWYRADRDKMLQSDDLALGVSGGICAYNVAAMLALDLPSDAYPAYEEDMICSIALRMNGYTLHDWPLIPRDDVAGDTLAMGDAPSRTERIGWGARSRAKWRGEFMPAA